MIVNAELLLILRVLESSLGFCNYFLPLLQLPQLVDPLLIKILIEWPHPVRRKIAQSIGQLPILNPLIFFNFRRYFRVLHEVVGIRTGHSQQEHNCKYGNFGEQSRILPLYQMGMGLQGFRSLAHRPFFIVRLGVEHAGRRVHDEYVGVVQLLFLFHYWLFRIQYVIIIQVFCMCQDYCYSQQINNKQVNNKQREMSNFCRILCSSQIESNDDVEYSTYINSNIRRSSFLPKQSDLISSYSQSTKKSQNKRMSLMKPYTPICKLSVMD